MPKHTQRIVVISPTYNEKGNISRLCQVLLDDVFAKVGDGYDPHILIVDDSSPDGTGKEVERLSKKYKNLHLLTNPKKMGLGNAYTKGMKYALDELKADIVFEFDADFQHDPTRIPPMLKELEKGADLVLGSRYIAGGSIPDSWQFHRKFLSVVGNHIIRLVITHFAIHDWTTGYRAIKRNVVEAVLPELNRETFMGYTFQIGFLHKTVRKGFKVAEVPIHFIDRSYGKSKLGTEYIKNTLFYIFKVRIREILSMRFIRFGIVGLFGAVIQLSALTLFRSFIPFSLANLLAIEVAIVSNFIWNNVWTFADRKLKATQIPGKFVQFNLASAGSIVIQEIVVIGGELLIGLEYLFNVGIVKVDTGLLFAITGILLGMIWNYFAYNRIVWNKRTT
jgi:dolichol-phosphate mannosyltransferase